MDSDSTEKWNHLSRARFDEILKQEIANLPADALGIYQTCTSEVLDQPCCRDAAYGIEHVFVVARDGARLLLFDDAEDEFGIGVADTDGVLRTWDLYGELMFALRNLKAARPPQS